jgi:hypothetical protein
VHVGVAISSICLAAAGVLLLFAPRETGAALMGTPSADALVQLLGAALLGFSGMNWTAKGAALGGIYGRAVLVGNQMHLFVGACVLVNRGFADGAASPAYWALTALYVAGAAMFMYLVFFSTGLRQR